MDLWTAQAAGGAHPSPAARPQQSGEATTALPGPPCAARVSSERVLPTPRDHTVSMSQEAHRPARSKARKCLGEEGSSTRTRAGEGSSTRTRARRTAAPGPGLERATAPGPGPDQAREGSSTRRALGSRAPLVSPVTSRHSHSRAGRLHLHTRTCLTRRLGDREPWTQVPKQDPCGAAGAPVT